MKKLRNNIFTIMAIVLITNPLYAKVIHDKDELHMKTKHEHNHSCAPKEELPKKDIQRAARTRLWMLSKNKKIANSWLNVPIVSTDKKKFEENVEWVVNYRDLNVVNEKKQNIYIFVDLFGHVQGVNYTGK